MKIVLAVAFAGIVFSMCVAQSTGSTNPVLQGQNSMPAPSNTTQPANAMKIAPGSVIPVTLAKTIDAKKVKPGEEVDAKVTQDLKSGTGEVVVPKDTKIVGKITEAQPR
jgi:type IV secretory pathway VirB10-like protein